MSQKNKKQFGVWMDTQHATVLGRVNPESDDFSVLGVSVLEGAEHQHKFFKEILGYMTNAEEVHLTGTGTSQEQLIHYMADTPQFKNTTTEESTSNKMSDENLVA